MEINEFTQDIIPAAKKYFLETEKVVRSTRIPRTT